MERAVSRSTQMKRRGGGDETCEMIWTCQEQATNLSGCKVLCVNNNKEEERTNAIQ